MIVVILIIVVIYIIRSSYNKEKERDSDIKEIKQDIKKLLTGKREQKDKENK